MLFFVIIAIVVSIHRSKSFSVNFYMFLIIFTSFKVVICHPFNQSLTFVCPVYDWCNFLHFSFGKDFNLFYITALFWYNSHTIHLIHLIHWFLVYSLIHVTITTVRSITSSSPYKETPFLWLSFPHLSSEKPLISFLPLYAFHLWYHHTSTLGLPRY